jgi:molecular chaperone DnaK
VKSALEGDDADAVKSAYEKLGQSSQKIGEALYSAEQQAAAGDTGATGDAPSAENADEDVVDAEIVDDEDDKDRK